MNAVRSAILNRVLRTAEMLAHECRDLDVLGVVIGGIVVCMFLPIFKIPAVIGQ